MWTCEGPQLILDVLDKFPNAILVSMDGTVPQMTQRLTIRQENHDNLTEYVYFEQDRLRSLYDYLGWLLVRENGRPLVISGLLEYLSEIYVDLLDKYEAGNLGSADFKEFTLTKVTMVAQRLASLHAILNDPQEVVDRLEKIYLPAGANPVATFRPEGSKMVSLSTVMKMLKLC